MNLSAASHRNIRACSLFSNEAFICHLQRNASLHYILIFMAVQDCSAFAGDLGAIDAKYDIAVSTSCAALDYVVVDNTATAQCCVEMLRSKGLGVATFLILDKQQHLAKALQEKPTAPEGVTLQVPSGCPCTLYPAFVLRLLMGN